MESPDPFQRSDRRDNPGEESAPASQPMLPFSEDINPTTPRLQGFCTESERSPVRAGGSGLVSSPSSTTGAFGRPQDKTPLSFSGARFRRSWKIGVPYPKPARIKLPSGHTVGCIHWPDSEFLQYGKAPVEGAADPETEVETGYTFDAETGIAAPVIEPRPLAEVQAEAVSGIKAKAFQLLQPTDWRVIRQVEGGDALDEATATYRAAVRQASNDAETAIASAETSVAVRETVTAIEWPQPSESEE